jgi:hypothetical protein
MMDERIQNAVNAYVNALATTFNLIQNDLTELVSPLLNRLEQGEFWEKSEIYHRETE